MKYGYLALYNQNREENQKNLSNLIDSGVHQTNIFKDVISSNGKRHNFEILLSICNTNDTIVVQSSTSIASNLNDLILLYSKLIMLNINLINLDEPNMSIDYDKDSKISLITFIDLMTNAIDNFKTTNAKISPALGRKRSAKIGRPEGLSQQARETAIKVYDMHVSGNYTTEEVCKLLNISRGTYYKYKRIIENEKEQTPSI